MANDNALRNQTISMHKVSIMFMAALIILFGWMGSALADSSTTATIINPTSAVTAEISADSKALNSAAKEHGQYSVRSLSGCKELQKLLAEARSMRRNIVRNHKNIVTAVAHAKRTNQNISWASTIYREDLKKQFSQLKTPRTAQGQYWQSMKTAQQAKDKSTMQEVMKQILSGRRQINAVYTSIITVQKQYLSTIKNPPKVL